MALAPALLPPLLPLPEPEEAVAAVLSGRVTARKVIVTEATARRTARVTRPLRRDRREGRARRRRPFVVVMGGSFFEEGAGGRVRCPGRRRQPSGLTALDQMV
ncbi:hypothetical protein GCM10010448_64130 [Streptomyces glomeratus]|uniref:Uncharacterized protein n=1 Tax=Streptomyces glomeratus TaxID=284452 RepID=A0ABP6M5N9_9ACTN